MDKDTIQPIQHPFLQEILQDKRDLLFNLVECFGSAVHILLPEVFKENISLFEKVLQQYEIKHRIMFAAKSNKGRSFLETCSQSGIGTDVSSLYELRSSLSHGISGSEIGASGPIKTDAFLLLAAQNNSLISIDCYEELEALTRFAEKGLVKNKVRILLRIGDLTDKESRFGIKKADLKKFYQILKDRKSYFDFRGFSFHLDSYSIQDRAEGIGQAYREIEATRLEGFDCDTINIGGGFTVQYLAGETGYGAISNNAHSESFYKGKKFDSFYPYSTERPKDKFLEDILLSVIAGVGKSVHELLRSNEISLCIEPGRALLDQAGFTLARVKGIRQSSKGGALVLVDANFNHLSEQWFNTDFIPGPIHIPQRQNSTGVNNDFIASVAGNTCMESDILTWRKKNFEHVPERDDLLAYVNTAGYQMDSNETDFHQIPLPTKLAVFRGLNGNIRYKKDTEFSQLDLI